MSTRSGSTIDRGGGFDDFRHGLHADPHAGIAAHREAVQAEVEVLLHGRREQHRHHAGLEDVVRLVRQRRRLRAVVVARQRQHAAVPARAGRVRVLEDIAAAVDARALAVPHREHAIDLRALEHVQLLRAPHRRGGKVLVQSGLEAHVVPLEVLACLPRRLVDRAERRAAIAADEAGRVQAGECVALVLEHRETEQRLRAAHVRAAAVQGPLVVEGDLRQGAADGFGERGVHEAPAKNRVLGSAAVERGSLLPAAGARLVGPPGDRPVSPGV